MRGAMDHVPIQWNRINSYATTPLLEIADAFERITKVVDSRKSGSTKEVRLDAFCDACSSLSVLFGCLGIAFKFADVEFASKVRDLTEASNSEQSLKEAATAAYAQACAPYHSWAVRTAVYAGIYALPSRDQLLLKLNETDESAEKKMRRFINAVVPIIEDNRVHRPDIYVQEHKTGFVILKVPARPYRSIVIWLETMYV